jgi:anti-anti-sigma factor
MPQFPQNPTAPTLNTLPPPFACTWGNESLDSGWVHVAGDLDLATTPRLIKALHDLQQKTCLIVLDLHEITFLDTTAIHTIVDASINARHDNRRLLLVGASTWVQRIFALTGTSHQTEISTWDNPQQPPIQAILQRARRNIAA